MIKDKIQKMKDLINADPMMMLRYPLNDVDKVTDWSIIPEEIVLYLGGFQLDTARTDTESLKDYYDIDTSKWRWIGAIGSDDQILQNHEDKRLYLLLVDDYLLQNFPAKDFGEFEYFIDNYVLGEKYLELTGGFEDKWYELLVRAGFAKK